MKLTQQLLLALTAIGLFWASACQAEPVAQVQGSATASPSASKYLTQGYKLYQQKSFLTACTYLQYAIEKENAGANAWLYLAHSQYAVGRRKEAIASYINLKEFYPSSPEATVARACLAKLDPQGLASKPRENSPPPASVAGSESSAVDSSLLKSVRIGSWRQDHPPITGGIVRLVKDTIKGLPEPVKLTLLKGNIKFLVAVTLVDQFPSLATVEGAGYDGHTYKRCPGMFRNGTVVICQNLIDEQTDVVEPPIPLSIVSQNFYHELGHALDACSGNCSLTDEYKHCYWLDIARIPDDAARRLSYFMQKSVVGQGESCAEITAVLLGGSEHSAEDIKTYFPLTMNYLRKKLNIN